MKITNVTPTERGGYDSQYGYMFTYNVTLDNGVTGEVSCKKENQWKPGDEVELVSEQSNQYGTKLRLKKPEMTGNRPYRDDRNIQLSIDSAWAINAALQWKHGQTHVVTPDELYGIAKQMLDLKSRLIAHMTNPNE
jgi:hypothetical protein